MATSAHLSSSRIKTNSYLFYSRKYIYIYIVFISKLAGSMYKSSKIIDYVDYLSAYNIIIYWVCFISIRSEHIDDHFKVVLHLLEKMK